MTPLSDWQNFYIIVGAAAGGLTGLQFVTMALVAEMPFEKSDSEAGEAFSTPSIVHFGAVLLLAALAAMPWRSITAAAAVWALAGTFGVLYTAWIARRIARQNTYKPVWEDWLYRTVVPLLAYLGWDVAAWLVRSHERAGLFLLAAAALVLLFVAIHNAWDNVTYLVFVKKREIQE